MKIYHGSDHIIEKPIFGYGKAYNDYGLGFYCSKSESLALEWSCSNGAIGYANEYELNEEKLKILNLNTSKYNILNWIAILLNNRTFQINSEISKIGKKFLLKNYLIDINKYDVVIGYRADDSYFRFAQDFLNNTISVAQLEKAMKLGKLGEQVVLISKHAFDNLTYIKSYKASENHLNNKIIRDLHARKTYLKIAKDINLAQKDIYLIDIIRGVR